MDRTGKQFGKYRLIRLLGQGGFADVYLGQHVLMGALAAIKILPNQISPADSQMFLQEARTLVALAHPNIVGVKDCDVQDGIPFIVVDYAPNGTLRQRHPRGTRVLLANVVSYVSQVASALQYAHNLNMIHRDVKPENMLLGRDNQVLLSDFGIAVIFSTALSKYAKDSAGTAIYMAPEQIMGRPRPASDQYSLGIVVYEWLCGAPPFNGTQIEITSQHLHAPPPPIYAQGVNIPPAVEAVVMKALAKQPEDRFPSVQDFAQALWNSDPQQRTNQRNVDSRSGGSIFLSPSDRSAQYTQTPPLSQPPQVPPAITPVNPAYMTPPPMPSNQMPVSSGIPPQTFTPRPQQYSAYPATDAPSSPPVEYSRPPAQTYSTHGKKRHISVWIIGSVVFSALILGVVYVYFTFGPVDVNGAVARMDSFCFDISGGFLSAPYAYSVTSSNYQNKHKETEFVNQFSGVDGFRGPNACLVDKASVSGRNVVVPMTVYFGGGGSTGDIPKHYTVTLIQENNTWVIDSIIQQS